MKKIVAFLLFFLFGLTYLTILLLQKPYWADNVRLAFFCVLAGGFGGCTYCLRGVYITACVKKQWTREWEPWYYIRPFVSVICGGISYLFLKAGLLVLESNIKSDASQLGFIAFAFVAGLNVDKFIAKIEDLAQVAWGIEKSRIAKENKNAEGKSK